MAGTALFLINSPCGSGDSNLRMTPSSGEVLAFSCVWLGVGGAPALPGCLLHAPFIFWKYTAVDACFSYTVWLRLLISMFTLSPVWILPFEFLGSYLVLHLYHLKMS